MSMRTPRGNEVPGQESMCWQERLLTAQQERMVKRLPTGYELVGVLGRTPIVRGPDGHISRMRTSGRLVRTQRVQAVQSYLLVQG